MDAEEALGLLETVRLLLPVASKVSHDPEDEYLTELFQDSWMFQRCLSCVSFLLDFISGCGMLGVSPGSGESKQRGRENTHEHTTFDER